jgi:hypothetical protein
MSGQVEGTDALKGVTIEQSFPIRDVLVRPDELTFEDRKLLIEQAIVLLDGLYVHLPAKRKRYDADPIGNLRLLMQRLPQIGSDVEFHQEMCDVFASLRDLHTNYCLPTYYQDKVAFLPFQVEPWCDAGKVKYLVSATAVDFNHPVFKPGVEVLSWNSKPISDAIAVVANQNAGSNTAAHHARGVVRLTLHALAKSPPPTESRIVVGYRSHDGKERQINFEWRVRTLEQHDDPYHHAIGRSAAHKGLDLEGDHLRRTRKWLYRRDGVRPPSPQLEIPSKHPMVFEARAVHTGSGSFGYLRIRSFLLDPPSDFVNEFKRLITHEKMPRHGLIVDVRDNSGGIVSAAEQALHFLSSKPINPEPMQFIETPLSRRLREIQSPDNPGASEDFSQWREPERDSGFSVGAPLTDLGAVENQAAGYDGPIVLIVNALCYSATDVFAAGFWDNGIGEVLGTDENTGAGGANVFTHEALRRLFAQAPPDSPQSPFCELPKGTGFRVALRRSLRVGAKAGAELEDLGIAPIEHSHTMTRDDILCGNKDLIAAAAVILKNKQASADHASD